MFSRKLFRRSSFTLVVAAVALAAPAAAQAGPLVASAPDCAEKPLTQPFLPWGDVAQYEFLRNGGFETGAAGWSLSGDASVRPGNESFYVHAAGDKKSLSLPAGASATTPTVCVGIEHPTLRLFARNGGSPTSSLAVEVLFEDATGAVNSLAIGGSSGGYDWQPTAPMPVVANLLPLLPGGYTPVAFRFTATGDGGDWRIDDVYVDPTRRN